MESRDDGAVNDMVDELVDYHIDYERILERRPDDS